MSTWVVVARIAGLAGRAAELRQLFAERALSARAEPGCAGYEVA
jgi:quinol monooxygenase YgiN